MRILCIGDIHGEWLKLNEIINGVYKHGHLDAIFQLGDFGMYPELYDSFRYNVDQSKIPFFVLDGNHEVPENYPQWKKALLNKGMRFVERGEYFPELKALCIGGAEHAPWEKHLPMRIRENTLITPDDIRQCLEHEGKEVNIILSHDAPYSFFQDIYGKKMKEQLGNMMLDYLLDKFIPKYWISAHHHEHIERKVNVIQWVSLNVNEEYVIEI